MVKSKMEAAVVDAGSKLLKAGPAIPDQAPSMVKFPSFCTFYSPFGFSEKFWFFGKWETPAAISYGWWCRGNENPIYLSRVS